MRSKTSGSTAGRATSAGEEVDALARLCRAAEDAAVEPWALLQAVRDPGGQIADFAYRAINPVAARQQGCRPEELLGRSVAQAVPRVVSSGLLTMYAHCVHTGEPLILDDFSYYGLEDPSPHSPRTHRYDIRAVRVEADHLSVTWRDVSERYEAVQRVAESEERFRLLAENSSDVVVHIRDLAVAWVSPSVEDSFGAPPPYWIGRPVESLLVADDLPVFAEILERTAAGETVVRRLRVRDVHGVAHWVEVHAKLFYDVAGQPDGRTVSLRVIDAEVAAETAAEEARRAQATAEARYRKLMDHSVVPTSLNSPQGRFVAVNQAICDFYGYDAQTLMTKTWQDLTAPEDLDRDAAAVGEILAGRRDSYQVTQQYIHADGHRMWGALSLSCLRKPGGEVENMICQIVDVSAEVEGRRQLADDYRLLEASADSMLDPQVVVKAVRDSAGRVVDFRCAAANRAACAYLDEEVLAGASALELLPRLKESSLLPRYTQCLEDGEPVVLNDFSNTTGMPGGDRRYDIRASRAGADLLSLTWTDVTERFQAAQRIAASEEEYRLLAENSGDVVTHIRDRRFVWVSPSIEEMLGAPPEHWIGREVREIFPSEDLQALIERLSILAAGGVVQQRIRVMSTDGVIHWAHLHSKPFYDAAGQMDGYTSSLRLIDNEVAAENAAAEARQRQAHADARYRALIENSAIPTKLIAPDGRFLMVNQAMCDLIGYDADTLLSMGWADITAPEDLGRQQDLVADLIAGRRVSFRAEKRYVHAGGHRIWADLSASSIRRPDGEVEAVIAQIVDITEAVTAREELAHREQENRVLAQSLQSELDGAAHYLRSVLPDNLAGRVPVCARYLPSNTLAGDCFDFLWIDDDHLVVYLLDVSGHGVKSALVAVSVHNLLRSGALDTATLLAPDRVLATLNEQFNMDRHDSNYLTMFYGVYQPSTGELRYANGGHPPALLRTVEELLELPSQAPPVGMFDDTTFPTSSLEVSPGSQLLVYSDGAYELPRDDGGQWSLADFAEVFTQLAASSPGWTLDQLVDQLRRHSASRGFHDDCTLVRVDFT